MSPVFTKLNLKGQSEIVILNAPESFEPELDSLEGVRVLRSMDEAKELHFALAFVTQQKQIDVQAASIAGKAAGDAVVWFAYPKGTSKKYRCDFNRDTGWHALGAAGFEAVRQVAIDEDWSAVRFRRAEFIKKMIREEKRAMTAQGRARVKKA